MTIPSQLKGVLTPRQYQVLNSASPVEVRGADAIAARNLVQKGYGRVEGRPGALRFVGNRKGKELLNAKNTNC